MSSTAVRVRLPSVQRLNAHMYVQQYRSQDKPNLSRLPDGTFPVYCSQINGYPSPYPTSPTATPLSIGCTFPPPAHTFINAVFDEFSEVENLSELGLQVSRYEFYISSRLDLAREIKWGLGPLAYVALAQERAQGVSTFWWDYKLEVVRGL